MFYALTKDKKAWLTDKKIYYMIPLSIHYQKNFIPISHKTAAFIKLMQSHLLYFKFYNKNYVEPEV